MRKYKLTGCFVDKEQKFALIHIYKNASISMRNVLGMRGKYHEWNDIKDSGVKTICVIRDPMKRVVSSYQYLLRLEHNGFINQHPIHITKDTNFFKNRDNPIKSFTQFVTYIEENGFYDAVTLPQTQFLSDRNIDIDDIDEVFVQERIDNDFSKFKKKYKIKNDISTDNISDSKITKILNDHISTNPQLIFKINNLYKEDFIMYYKFI
tara:strand:- start:2957 stop:3580 length:624 start_codon:yes stop_codon:yes gene_type:complete